jgi:RNA-directed DNA polymerase
MKRAGHLIEKIADLENLQWAYYKAQKGKVDKKEVREYGKRLQANLQNLQEQILSGEVETGNYHFFTIYDPKKRLICAAPFGQRVLHHALMNGCHPFFEKVQIFDSYATRLAKGTYAALERAKRFNQQYQWFLKLDYRKYFDSLDHTVLKEQLHELFKDRRLLHIFERIIDSYAVNENQGVPIGNLTSQYFANHYLAGADHYVKESLQIRAFVRYMDDSVLWHGSKEILLQAGFKLNQYAAAALKLTLKPFCLNQNSHGLPFLGYLLYPDRTRLAQRSRQRFVKKLRLYADNLISGVWTQKEYQDHVLPLIAFTEHAAAKAFRKTIMASL